MSRSFLGDRGQDPVARLDGGCVPALQGALGCFIPMLASVSALLLRESEGRAAFVSSTRSSECLGDLRVEEPVLSVTQNEAFPALHLAGSVQMCTFLLKACVAESLWIFAGFVELQFVHF